MDHVNGLYSDILKKVILKIFKTTTKHDEKVLSKLHKAGKLLVR